MDSCNPFYSQKGQGSVAKNRRRNRSTHPPPPPPEALASLLGFSDPARAWAIVSANSGEWRQGNGNDFMSRIRPHFQPDAFEELATHWNRGDVFDLDTIEAIEILLDPFGNVPVDFRSDNPASVVHLLVNTSHIFSDSMTRAMQAQFNALELYTMNDFTQSYVGSFSYLEWILTFVGEVFSGRHTFVDVNGDIIYVPYTFPLYRGA